MSAISQNLTSTPFDENAFIKAEALMEAAQGDSLHRLFPDHHRYHRTWAILTPHGSVTVEDHDLNWYTIMGLKGYQPLRHGRYDHRPSHTRVAA